MDHWESTFTWYPEAEKGDIISVRATLTKLDPTEYREIVHEWPIRDFIIWSEESRVRDVFQDMTEDNT